MKAPILAPREATTPIPVEDSKAFEEGSDAAGACRGRDLHGAPHGFFDRSTRSSPRTRGRVESRPAFSSSNRSGASAASAASAARDRARWAASATTFDVSSSSRGARAGVYTYSGAPAPKRRLLELSAYRGGLQPSMPVGGRARRRARTRTARRGEEHSLSWVSRGIASAGMRGTPRSLSGEPRRQDRAPSSVACRERMNLVANREQRRGQKEASSRRSAARRTQPRLDGERCSKGPRFSCGA